MRNNYYKLLTLIILLAAFLVSCRSSSGDKKPGGARQSGPQIVEGFIVRPSVLEQSATVSGTIRSFEETTLMPDISGRVIMINLPEGQPVKKGAVLVKLFDSDLQAGLRKLQTQLEIARQTLKRQSELLTVSGISQLEYDQTRLQVNSIGDDIETLKAQISKTEVVAPYDGIIGLRNISLGAQVTPSTPLATIREVDQLKLDFSIPGKYSAEITDGKVVRFTVEGSDTSFSARVIASEGGLDATTRNLKVRALITRRDHILRPGMFATVDLPLAVIPDALLIPTQAIIPQERNKKVIVVHGGKAEFVTVRTGVRRPKDVEVTAGLNPGDTIVTTGVLFLRQGSEVKLVKLH